MLHSTSASPSRHMSGLSIEEDAGEAIEATTGVLGGCRFVAHGAVVLDDEISARGDDDDDAAATTTTTAAATPRPTSRAT